MPPRRACDICAKRKIQCSLRETGPPCDWCSNQGIECTSLREPQRKRSLHVSADEVRSLSRRIEQLEDELTRKSSCSGTPTTSSHSAASPRALHSPRRSERQHASLFQASRTTTDASPRADLTLTSASPQAGSASDKTQPPDSPLKHHLGKNWYFKGTPILSEAGKKWMSASTGQSRPFETFDLFDAKSDASPLFPAYQSHQVPGDHSPALPSARHVTDIFEALCGSSKFAKSPIPSPSILELAVTEAYSNESEPRSWSRSTAQAYIWSSLVFMSSFRRVRQVGYTVNGEECAQMAESLLSTLLTHPTTASLQSIIMLQVYRMKSGHWSKADSLHSLSCRVLCQLNGHLQSLPMDDARQRDSIRGLFWLLYTLDKDMSLQAARPPQLTSDYCGLHDGVDCDEPSTAALMEAVVQPGRDIPLAVFKEDVCKLLWSSNAWRSTDAQTLLNIRHADEQLETWRLSQPEDIRPRLSMLADRLSPTIQLGSKTRSRVLDLQLEYLHLLSIIHATVRRTGGAMAENENLPDDLHGVVHSSIDITLEAGHSTLLCLRAAIEFLEEDSFHHVIAYGPLATMSLFVNVLVHPLDQRAHADLEAITYAVEIFQKMPLRWLSSHEIEQLQELSEFAMELVRLGRCAIWEVKKKLRK